MGSSAWAAHLLNDVPAWPEQISLGPAQAPQNPKLKLEKELLLSRISVLFSLIDEFTSFLFKMNLTNRAD